MNALHYRLISVGITMVAIALSRAGIGTTGSNRLILWSVVGLVSAALWAAPYVERWWQRRHKHENEAAHLIAQGRIATAEEPLEQAWEEIRYRPSSTSAKKLDLLLNLAEAQRLNRHFEKAWNTLKLVESISISTPRLPEARARLYTDQGQLAMAEEAWRAAIIAEQSTSPIDKFRLGSHHAALGLLQRCSGSRAVAAENLRIALAMFESTVGPTHPETARILGLLGAGYQEDGNTAEALACLARAISIHESASGLDSPQLAQELYHFALASQQAKNFEDAARAYERVLTLRERLVGTKNDELALVLYNLGHLYLQWGRLARAEELLRRCVSLMRGRADHRTAAALNALAMVFERAGRCREAEPLCLEALQIWQQTLGPQHSETIQAAQRFASVLRTLNRDQEAEGLLRHFAVAAG